MYLFLEHATYIKITVQIVFKKNKGQKINYKQYLISKNSSLIKYRNRNKTNMAFKTNRFKDLFQLFALLTLIEINPTQLQIKIKVGVFHH